MEVDVLGQGRNVKGVDGRVGNGKGSLKEEIEG